MTAGITIVLSDSLGPVEWPIVIAYKLQVAHQASKISWAHECKYCQIRGFGRPRKFYRTLHLQSYHLVITSGTITNVVVSFASFWPNSDPKMSLSIIVNWHFLGKFSVANGLTIHTDTVCGIKSCAILYHTWLTMAISNHNSLGSDMNDHCFLGFVLFMLQHEVPVAIYEQQGRACLSNML